MVAIWNLFAYEIIGSNSAWCLQDNFLFDGTIAENIGFSHPHATREQIVAASRVAALRGVYQRFRRRLLTLSLANAALSCPADSDNAWPLRAQFWQSRKF